MKKIAYIAAGVIAVIIAGIFLINVKNENTDVTKERTKVGVLLIGSHDDNSYNQSHYEALEKTAKSLNLNVIYKENVPTDERCKKMMEELIRTGCKIIVCNSYDFGKWALNCAEENPDIYFFHASGVEQRKNLATFFARIYQMRYLSGIVAGLQTETNEIGYVAAYPISEVNRGINAFTLGVRSVNKDATVHVSWSNSWTDDEQAGAAAAKLLDHYEIDVVAMHTDSNRVLEEAEARGIWSIGYNVDNSALFPKSFLTAPVWDWEKYYEPNILRCLQGKFRGENFWEGADTGVVRLAAFSDNVKDGIEQIVLTEKHRMEQGLFDVFYGPIRDNTGKLRVEEGENLSDYTMLNRFDWYVEGVVIHE